MGGSQFACSLHSVSINAARARLPVSGYRMQYLIALYARYTIPCSSFEGYGSASTLLENNHRKDSEPRRAGIENHCCVLFIKLREEIYGAQLKTRTSRLVLWPYKSGSSS